MKQKNPLLRLILTLAVLVGSNLACNLPGSASDTLPPTARPMSTEEVQNLEQQVQQTLENPNESGEVTITLTQDQVNSMLAAQIAQQPELGVSDSSVILTGGNVEVYSKVTQNGVSANLKAVMQPNIDSDGELKLNIASMTLGGLPVPDVLKDRVATMAENAFNNYLTANANNFKAKSIQMGEGQMTITGTR